MWRLRKQTLNSQGCHELYLVFFGSHEHNAEYIGYIKNKNGFVTAIYHNTDQIYRSMWHYNVDLTKNEKRKILKAFIDVKFLK